MSRATVHRAMKRLQDRGEASFYEPRRGRGVSVITGAAAANRLLAEGRSGAARELGIAKSTVYYNLRHGFLGAGERPDPENLDEAPTGPDDLLGRGVRDRVAPMGRARPRRARRSLDGGRSGAALRRAALGGRRRPGGAAGVAEGRSPGAPVPVAAERVLRADQRTSHARVPVPGRNPEALRHEAPGERGAVLGLDRCLEARTLRHKIKVLASDPQRVRDWQDALA